MSKAEDRYLEHFQDGRVRNCSSKEVFLLGYHKAEKDIKEELSNLFQEFMLDCIKDDTETHILHFIDVFNNKIKTIGNE